MHSSWLSLSAFCTAFEWSSKFLLLYLRKIVEISVFQRNSKCWMMAWIQSLNGKFPTRRMLINQGWQGFVVRLFLKTSRFFQDVMVQRRSLKLGFESLKHQTQWIQHDVFPLEFLSHYWINIESSSDYITEMLFILQICYITTFSRQIIPWITQKVFSHYTQQNGTKLKSLNKVILQINWRLMKHKIQTIIILIFPTYLKIYVILVFREI